LTESRAIYRYLARTFHIGNFQDPEQAHDEMIGDVVSDLLRNFGTMLYDPKFLEIKDEFLTVKLPPFLEPIEVWLSGDDKYNKENKKNNIKRDWLGGKHLCYVDFQFWIVLHILLNFSDKSLSNFPHLQKYHSNFKQIKNIKYFLEHDEKSNYPVNTKFTHLTLR